ncbi:hypothetical protein HNQ93_000347 [Hymenobacter luteus]|uniref:Uncharacterized protein n=2 Tax=Hymenobacter TaxID=89966 RepID=A0A7W9WBD3_9BACT|nr:MULTISPECIES: hypothetical protein [Hymenobacter]MBB4600173.1 hypothetical protein [Hymenobacter latericoloratus]MBB6057517.1 hypothetical protein [Hymenobacter luteus]
MPPCSPSSDAYEPTAADFAQWVAELLPGIGAAIAQQGFEKGCQLPAFQSYLQERGQPVP